jgi:hypothetical protein
MSERVTNERTDMVVVKNGIEKFGSYVSVFCSVLTVAFVVWRGGELANTISEHDRRLAVVEHEGSISMQKHAAEGKAVEQALRERLNRLEIIAECIPEIRIDIREIKTELKLHTAKTP